MDERKEDLLKYAELHDQAMNLQDRFNDAIDNRHHPMVYNMQQEMHGFVESFEMRAKPRQIEERAKKMQDQLHALQVRKASFMSAGDVDQVHGHLAEMRQHLRNFEDY